MAYLIGISGKKQSGKNTVAEFIATYFTENCNSRVGMYSFANILKDTLVSLKLLTAAQAYGSDDQKNSSTRVRRVNAELLGIKFPPSNSQTFLTARELLQIVGTDILRLLWPDIWVHNTLNSIHEHFCSKQSIVRRYDDGLVLIMDCRFRNEMHAIQGVGGKVIRLTRTPYNDTHISETQMDGIDNNYYDFVLDNANMTIEQQNSALEPILEEWFKASRREIRPYN